MPCYSPTGQICTKDDAYTGGRLRPGYRHIAEDGEYLGFDLAFRDSKPASASVYITDATPGTLDYAIKAAADSFAIRANISPQVWLAGRTPTQLSDFLAGVRDAYNATVTASGRHNQSYSRAMALANYGDTSALAQFADHQEASYQRSKADLNRWRDDAAVVATIRDARYQG